MKRSGWLAGVAIVISLLVIGMALPAGVSACYIEGNCRMTGGGNATSGIDILGGWDGTFAKDSFAKHPGGSNRYTMGGQAGANTALEPQPEGNWTHHQQFGPDGSFVFHGNVIDIIVCSDPGWCEPAREAPAKQIDFAGYGVFRNIDSSTPALAEVVPNETVHWFHVHIEDLGEPGSRLKRGLDLTCPPEGSFGASAMCGCLDFYKITIYSAGSELGDTTTPIYQVYGYLNGGNFQIHPPTGFDLK